ncbi:YeeE/YedE family protein [Pseudorhodoplanes sp.]|uniref:YeeE/YedE family protein n=1 Tax=Pseudorhodoplanes sp. TaxID=1934341 RepID=UPI002C038614|nr:YeeE/YedE family protein [Pseudorhodoplanes sp.]HWV41945.1 YeeE/YedE family protein [Pseudorhodoplanes sp.]
MFDDLSLNLVRFLLGLGLGSAFGFVARRGRFCTLGAIEDSVYANDTRRLRSWLLAIAVAVVGVHLLEAHGELDLTKSIYTGSRLELGALILGGLIFGFGMALNGTCGMGTLRQIGGGDLRAVLTFLVMGVTAMMTMRGLTGIARVAVTDPLAVDLGNTATQRLPLLAGFTGQGATIAAIAIGLVIAVYAFAHREFRATPRFAITGLLIGLIVVGGWWATGIVGYDSFDTRRIESFTFVGPLGETLLYGMLSTALSLDFPIGAVLGFVFGAFVAAISDGTFRWQIPASAAEFRRRVAGAFMMGFGGITALGCTIGQGVTGVSTLSVGSIIAIVSIVAGARLGLYWVVERGPRTARSSVLATSIPATAGAPRMNRVSCTEP